MTTCTVPTTIADRITDRDSNGGHTSLVRLKSDCGPSSSYVESGTTGGAGGGAGGGTGGGTGGGAGGVRDKRFTMLVSNDVVGDTSHSSSSVKYRTICLVYRPHVIFPSRETECKTHN